MVNLILIVVFTIVFGALTWRRFEWGLFLLFLLLPTYLLRFHIGPLPSTLLEIMLLVLVGIWIIKNHKSFVTEVKSFYTNHLLLFLGIKIFLLGATISIFTSVNIRAAAGEWRAFYIEPVLLFFTIVFYFKNLEETKRRESIQKYILFPLILCALGTSLLAIYQHFTGWFVPHAFWANRDTYRVTGWYGFPNAVGLFLAPIIPLALYLVQKNWEKNKTVAIVSILTIATSLLAIIFAKGSGPIISVVAGLGILLLTYKKTRISALAFGLVALGSIFFLPATHPIKQELFATNYSGQLRRDIWNETIHLLKDRPILGAGIASYEERIVPYRGDHWIEVFHHPHNILLTIWINTGILGLIGFLLILIWFFITAVKNLKYKINFILASMVVILTMGLVDSPYIKNDLAILFWILPALLIIESYKKNISTN